MISKIFSKRRKIYSVSVKKLRWHNWGFFILYVRLKIFGGYMSKKIQNITVQFKSIKIALMFTKLALPNEKIKIFMRIETTLNAIWRWNFELTLTDKILTKFISMKYQYNFDIDIFSLYVEKYSIENKILFKKLSNFLRHLRESKTCI